MRPTLFAVLLLAACEAPITSTSVDGAAAGVSFKNPTAISRDPAGSSGSIYDPPPVVLITDVASACSRLKYTGLFSADGVTDASGNQAQALILRGASTAYLDTVGDAGRVTATTARIDAVETRSDGTLVGRFEVKFGEETMSGTYVATPCAGLSAGCSATGGMGFALLAVLVLRQRRFLR